MQETPAQEACWSPTVSSCIHRLDCSIGGLMKCSVSYESFPDTQDLEGSGKVCIGVEGCGKGRANRSWA